MSLKDFLIEIALEWNSTHETKIPMQFITFVLNQVEKRNNERN